MPLGPNVSGAQWRACAQLQVSVHCSLVWGHGIPRPHFICHLSRVTAKSSDFTCMVFFCYFPHDLFFVFGIVLVSSLFLLRFWHCFVFFFIYFLFI